MKKIILSCAAYLITLSVYAQSDSLTRNVNQRDNSSNSNNKLNNKVNEDGYNQNQDNNISNPKAMDQNKVDQENNGKQDSIHTLKPIQHHITPVNPDPALKQGTPATSPAEKSSIKKRKDNNMQLVPDSIKNSENRQPRLAGTKPLLIWQGQN